MKSVLNWSGGKDSALCLRRILQGGTYTIDCLLTILGSTTQHITMHGVRQHLLEQQARQMGLPLQQMFLPEDANIDTYNNITEITLHTLQQQEGIRYDKFGDINLQDLRNDREQQLAKVGLQAVSPLWWNSPTQRLVREFLEQGFQAVVVSVIACSISRLQDACWMNAFWKIYRRV
ncbi:hypothetical protein ACMA1I_04700 [Pontibacter sp. 13R65]|uniref:Dph6-related ATP pyrophosphatase n=1 Tax=Pontibacter sp. 13R65 TaxID=3127458 RepID=UPI00301D51C2